MLQYERKLLLDGFKLIGGMDEAGRGPLAGPVVSAAVILPLDDLIEGVDDSKKLSEKKRNQLYEKIMQKAYDVQICTIDNQTIDQINILNATKQAMLQCVDSFKQIDCILIDAVKLNTQVPSFSIVHGDALSYSIAAASIVAKVTRDEIMRQYDKQHPQYLFAKNKGYGTPEHIERLQKYGACCLHRKSFIKNFAL